MLDVLLETGIDQFALHQEQRGLVVQLEIAEGQVLENRLLQHAPREGRGFDTLIYGRPEGMTIEHCVLSAAFDREPATCRDLCVRDHPLVQITDPTGYTFAVATDSSCRNRLLHSRPIEGSEFLPQLWSAGIRAYRMLFNLPGDPVAEITSRYREALDAISEGGVPPADGVRMLVGSSFTRGHFARGVERDVLWQKFSDCAGIVIDREHARRLFDALQDLPKLASISGLRPSLAPAAE